MNWLLNVVGFNNQQNWFMSKTSFVALGTELGLGIKLWCSELKLKPGWEVKLLHYIFLRKSWLVNILELKPSQGIKGLAEKKWMSHLKAKSQGLANLIDEVRNSLNLKENWNSLEFTKFQRWRWILRQISRWVRI